MAIVSTKREHTLGIWALALGYFLFYIPYSGLSKAVTSGLLTDGKPISGFELLPSTVVSTAVAMLLFITIMGWWRYAPRRPLFGYSVPLPNLHLFVSGVSFAVIIATTTLAYSFGGVSIVFAMLLMRGGVLIMSPFVDRVFGRRVRWFSWTGLILSLIALAIAFSDVDNYQLSLIVVLNLAAYLTGYVLRLPCMTKTAKTRDADVARGYFVEEQLVAMPALVLLPAMFALIGKGRIMLEMRQGFADLVHNNGIILPGLLIGLFYAGLGVCGTLIYLDRRENTFCIPLNRCSSLLSGIVASWLLAWWLHAPDASNTQLSGALLILAALLVMSPLHHLPLYITQLKAAIREKRLVLVEFNHGRENTQSTRFITVNFHAIREALRSASRAEKS